MAPGVLHRVIYGSSQPEAWQKELTTVRPALLQSFRRHRVRHADFPAIIPKEGSSVRGTYVTGLTEGDIFRLDIFEGDMYERQKVTVQILKDSIGQQDAVDETRLDELVAAEAVAETYVWKQELADSLEEQEWDFEEFKRDRMGAWMGEDGHPSDEVDEGFADVDRAVAEEEARIRREGGDPHGLKADPSGGRVNGKIAKDLAAAAV